MSSPSRPDVFTYHDYRAYLRDYYAFGKERFGLSHRAMARRVGVRSPSFLKLVMEGKRNLSVDTAQRVGRACRLTDSAVEYFVALVRFDQAEDSEQRRLAYKRLQRFARYRRVQALELARDAYHRCWYYPAIRELVASPHFREEPRWIGRALRPRIRASQARSALQALEKLGLLTRDDEGRLQQADALVTSGPETGSVHLAQYHRTMMHQAAAAIDDLPREQRDISSLTLCVDAEGLARLKQRIQDIRQELLVEEAASDAGDRIQVVQINFQLFPLSAKLDEEGSG